jgi:hypothetical protein
MPPWRWPRAWAAARELRQDDERPGQGPGHEEHQYKNPEGLTEPGHLTTARDLSILATRLMHDFPEYMHYYATKQYRYPARLRPTATTATLCCSAIPRWTA